MYNDIEQDNYKMCMYHLTHTHSTMLLAENIPFIPTMVNLLKQKWMDYALTGLGVYTWSDICANSA